MHENWRERLLSDVSFESCLSCFLQINTPLAALSLQSLQRHWSMPAVDTCSQLPEWGDSAAVLRMVSTCFSIMHLSICSALPISLRNFTGQKCHESFGARCIRFFLAVHFLPLQM